ncbi:hypothetical protein KJ865_06525 [Myxococcota bacterium]|nr:hypothetical protein [Myxococcota bacterium]
MDYNRGYGTSHLPQTGTNSDAPHGGFGGGDCTVTHVPVIFIHGNGDEAKNWDYPNSTGVPAACLLTTPESPTGAHTL